MKILRSKRKTIALQILPDGTLLVRCPLKMKEADILRFVESKAAWVAKHTPTAPPPPRFTEEELEDLTRRAKVAIPARVEYFAQHMGLSYGRVTIRHQRTRWGSCSGKGNLNFNCLLMEMPEDILDYVVVHELCHLKHMDHSKAFWAAVEEILPDYKTRRNYLKEQANTLLQRLP